MTHLIHFHPPNAPNLNAQAPILTPSPRTHTMSTKPREEREAMQQGVPVGAQMSRGSLSDCSVTLPPGH